MKAQPHPGPAPYLTPARERRVLGRMAENPTTFGYRTDLWTARRVAGPIWEKPGVAFNPNCLRE